MKKLLSILLITTLTALESTSQTSNDTLCIPVSQLKKAINKIEEGKVAAKEVVILKDKIELIERKVVVKDSLIGVYLKNESNYSRLINNYETSLLNNTTQINNLEISVKYYKKIARRQKFQKWAVGIIGIGLGVLLIK
jgi:hemerythrin-like domain-containing protein